VLPFVDLSEEATLSGGERELREDLALLLLDRRPVSMNGKRSFIKADLGVSTRGCDVEEVWLGVRAGRCLEKRGVGSGLLNLFSCICSTVGGVLSGVTSLNVSVCGCDLSSTDVPTGVVLCCSTENGNVCLSTVSAASTDGVIGSKWGVMVSHDGRSITVVSSCSVWDVRVLSLRYLLEGVRYCSLILRSSWLVNSMLETSCDSQAFQSRLERAESGRRGDGVPTT
jgi:hypothetical protein